MAFFTYIMASKPYGTLYTGSTDDIWRRTAEHRAMENPGFTQKYGVTRLVWIEQHESRAWKIQLIEADNPHWSDLIEHLDQSFSF